MTIVTIYYIYDYKNVTEKADQEKKQTEATLNKALKKDYPVYIDGREVDASNINFSDYRVRIDTKQKKILCTRK